MLYYDLKAIFVKNRFMKKSKFYFLALIISLLAIQTSCIKKDDNWIPNVYVNFQINPNSTEYINLNIIGGYEYLYGGVKGIIVYREDMENFRAYDRACPFDYDVHGSSVVVDSSGLILVDTLCGSKFIITDGSVLEGPAKRGLKQYRTHYNGEYLQVYN
jgi:nitrite reductase/ring-hydroxylating ferredoxin subunit